MPTTRALQEIILAVHFEAPLNMTVRDIVSFSNLFEHNYPLYQEVPPNPKVEINSQENTLDISMLNGVTLPKIVLRTEDQTRLLQLQADRFAIGWARTQPVGVEVEYPGYVSIRADLVEIFDQVNAWHSNQFGGFAKYRMAEISYFNAIPAVENGVEKKISDVLKVFALKGRRLHQLSVNWAEFLEDRPDAPQVHAQAGIAIVGPGIPAIAYNFTGLGTVGNAEDAAPLLGVLDSLHARILDMHAAAIISG